MIHALTGILVSVTAHQAVLACGHMEFEIIISAQTASTLSQLSPEKRQHVRLLTYLQHREDAMVLFGFLSEQERIVFEQLQTVPGIGAKQAVKILGGMSLVTLLTALDQGDVKTLSRIPGVGSKTAQRLILALRGTLVLEDDATPGKAPSPSATGRWTDLSEALQEMGYDRKKVMEILARLEKEHESEMSGLTAHQTEELMFRNAIIALG
ncbi:Holliday junction branch migration protein RuvA [Parasphaerochaeta coccoides]|uniref:Holliday junction branch migration complex subunit RuvA n=1 Tax=Parasphaerochaeta coccoides (strain ATCC BAA-1237 / DSM 17374 / SPN1) TaxID=760011 RepID=F4GK40_PARC1|nr:Holliday junction branch migration protein RuvA [Parasphaerochaeta coccoides]AEC01812.1 Holliday junction ATP-dependent DNA helicase ruvA [Parasphaerochaeta coccoides DSM 17374]